MINQIQTFNGADYNHARDGERLTKQHDLIYDLMKDGQARTLRGIALLTGQPESSVSAQLRHLRKPRFGGHTVNKHYLGNGLYEYVLIVNVEGD